MKEIQPEIVIYRVAQTVENYRYIPFLALLRKPFQNVVDTYVHEKDSPDVLHVLSYINILLSLIYI